MTTTTKTPLSDLAMRILCTLPLSPVYITQANLRADMIAETGDKSLKLGAALVEVETRYGLERKRVPSIVASRKTQTYSLPESGWREAQTDGAKWWAKNMKESGK